MDDQMVVIRVEGAERESITLTEYLRRFIDGLVPLSVGQCFRFSMRRAVIDVQPPRTYREAIVAAETDGQASAVSVPGEGVILVLPKPVQVDVKFDGDHVIKAANLLSKIE